MEIFKNQRIAATYIMRRYTTRTLYLFDGPEDNYVVADVKTARGLITDGHRPYSNQQVAVLSYAV